MHNPRPVAKSLSTKAGVEAILIIKLQWAPRGAQFCFSLIKQTLCCLLAFVPFDAETVARFFSREAFH